MTEQTPSLVEIVIRLTGIIIDSQWNYISQSDIDYAKQIRGIVLSAQYICDELKGGWGRSDNE